MKTILYQPLFINPQAYFVFPQLYHIEKGDSYIEPANITGQLIINDLTKSLTSTPILNVVQDTNQVDFGLFKGKHIRISQYTNIGAVVLGEWYIPGTPTPPEPEQPDWFKESIVAWYSPYCKQKLTNYDVIEAYVEDFTKWAYRDSRGIAKITNNTIVITNVVETNNIIEDDNEPYSDLTIRVTGVTENKYLIVRQGRGKPESHIKKDGVYTFKDNNLYFGFGVSVIGECNITITQLPTSILKDFSGNGNHAYLYGGKGKLNSGMGLYKVDFTSWRKSSVQTEVKPDVVKVTPNTSDYLFIQYANSVEIPSYKIKVIGLGDNVLKYQYATENGRKEINIVEGENELPTSIKVSNNYQIGYRLTPGTSVFTITQIPDYPDQLCYDGKMFAVAYGLPILTDYTIIADRTWFNYIQRACFLSKILHAGKGAFGFEIFNEKNEYGTYSFGTFNDVAEFDKNIVYQTKKSYNGRKSLIHGPVSITDYDELYLGKLRSNEKNMFIGCHGDILLFNRTLTDDELDLVKEHFFGIEPNIKDALMTTDKKYLALVNNNNYIKLHK